MADYYVGMKQETFLAHNMCHIRCRERVFDCEGGYSEYQWDDRSVLLILWSRRFDQLRIIYIEEQKGISRL
ncbi:hypothetical protein F4X33_02860 [Candidatus Poribacteria bacterium]|nr:hypothetical protein [Candidatus Poribacteria bacterium]